MADGAVPQRGIKVCHTHTAKGIDAADKTGDFGGVMIGHLAAVRSIAFIAVIFGGIVAGRNHNTGLAVKFPYGVGEHRRGLQFIEQMHGNAVGGQHARRLAGEQIGFDTRIKRYRHGCGGAARFQIIGKALSGAANGINIHAVASGADDAAKPARPKLQVAVKSILDPFFVSFDVSELFDKIDVLRGIASPQSIVVHHFLFGHMAEQSFRQKFSTPTGVFFHFLFFYHTLLSCQNARVTAVFLFSI